MQVQVSGIRF